MSGGSRDPVLRIAGGGGGGAAPGPAPWNLPLVIGSLSNHHHDNTTRQRQRKRQKIVIFSKTTALQCMNLFCTFLWRLLHDYDVKPPHATFFGDVDIRWSIFLSLFEPGHKVLKNSTPRKFAYIWHIEQVQIDALKFERRQIHLFSDFFTAVVAIVDTCLSSLYHWIDLKNEHDLWTKGL